jgi:hypothetical protein
MPEGFIQTNVNLTSEDVQMLDKMMVEDAYDNRSAFVRRLIRQEYARRYSQPQPCITIGQIEEKTNPVFHGLPNGTGWLDSENRPAMVKEDEHIVKDPVQQPTASVEIE